MNTCSTPRRGAAARSIVALVAGLTIALAACTSGGANSQPAGSDGATTVKLSFFSSGLSIPVMVGLEGGYFKQAGLNVQPVNLQSSAATTALAGGQLDMYLGGATVITARVQGQRMLYVGDLVDKSPETLMVRPDIRSWTDLNGKKVATTGVGAFGEILMRKKAKQEGLTAGEQNSQVTLINTADNNAAVAQLLAGNVAGAIVTSPADEAARARGMKSLTDFNDEGDRVVGPGLAVMQNYLNSHPDAVKDFLVGYLNALKRSLDDPTYAKKVFEDYTHSNAETAQTAYDENKGLWNQDLTVPSDPIQTVLDNTSGLNAGSLKPTDFYDNSIIANVNATTAKSLFPNASFAS